MDEVRRTHPVLTAAIKGDLEQMRRELAKAPKRINEVRRDMRLGPPLREPASVAGSGITELMNRGAKCSATPSARTACGPTEADEHTDHRHRHAVGHRRHLRRRLSFGQHGALRTGSTGGYRLPGSGGYPVPRPSPGDTVVRPPYGTMR